jgi:hypothetical protein
MIRALRALLRQIEHSLNRAEYDRSIADELEAHVELHAAENIRLGMDPVTARRHALIKLGGVQQTMERCWDAGTIRWLGRLKS